MKITREQVNKINAKMGNGWKLDLYYLLTHGEKTAEIRIPTEDGGYIQGKLYIDNVQGWRPGEYSGVQIKLNVSRWYSGNTDGVFTSSGLGHWVYTNRPDMNRALFSEVQKLTHRITAENILELYHEHAGQIASARVL